MEKLLAIVSLIQRSNGRRLFQSILPNLVLLAGLVIVTAIMVSVALVGILVLTYCVLIDAGVAPYLAMIVIAIFTLVTILGLILLMLLFLQRLRRTPRLLLEQSPLVSRAINTLDAFTEGFMAD